MIVVFNVISSVFDFYILYIFFNGVFHEKKKPVPGFLFVLCFALTELILLANTYINPASLSLSNKLITIALSVGSTFALCFLYYTSLRQKILATVFFQLIAAVSETLLALIMFLVAPSFLETDTLFVNCFMETMSKFFMFVLVILFTGVWGKKINLQNVEYNLLVLSTPLVSIIIGLFIPNNSAVSDSALSFFYLLFISLLILNILNFYLLKDLLSITELKNKASQLELDISYQKEKYQQLNRSYRDTRRIVHDMKNHYSAIEKLALSEKKENLLEYLNSSIHEIESAYAKYNTGNLVVDSLLHNCDNLATSLNIPFNTDLNVDPNKVAVNDYDLCVILGNMLDNSINACKKLSPPDAWISVSIHTTENHILIKTGNEIPADTSPATDTMLHGFGTENIRAICEKYKGFYEISRDNGIYSASIAIPIVKQSPESSRYLCVIDK